MSYDDYQPLKPPGCLEKVLIVLMMIVSAIFWKKGRK